MQLHEYSSVLNQLNKETLDHSSRVANISRYLAEQLKMDEDIAYKIGLLHDVGKIYIPSRIVRKSTKLTEVEREIIDLHAYFGYKMLKSMGESSMIYMPVLFHHGYWKPKLTLCDDEPLDDTLTKYVCVIHSADVFDAMTSKRVYHEPFSKEKTLKELSSDILSSAEIVKCLSEMDEEKEQKIRLISSNNRIYHHHSVSKAVVF